MTFSKCGGNGYTGCATEPEWCRCIGGGDEVGLDHSLAMSVGEAIDELHCCDASAWKAVGAIRKSMGLDVTPDPVEFLEHVEAVIREAAQIARERSKA